jgi:hypothetical protein
MTMDMDQEWARWQKLYGRRYDPNAPVEIKDQPLKAYHDFDITQSGYDMREPYYVPRKRGVGAAETLMFILVVGLCLPIVARVALWIAEAIA